MKVVLATLNAKYIHSSLALRYLQAYCRARGEDPVVKEYTINNELLTILGDITRETPQIVGFACYIWNLRATLELVRLLKKVLPKTIIVLGGPEVSYDAGEILRDNLAVDYIIQGEGEQILAALLAVLRENRSAGGIAGLAGRDGAGGSTPQIVERLDELPFPYTEADMAALGDKIVYYESSRGCPFACQYCLSSATTGVRYFSLERVKRDLTFFIAHGVRQVKFVDRTFNARREHYFPILQFLKAQAGATNFHFEIAADILDDEVVTFLADAPPGRFQFEIGVQSTNPATLAAIKRVNDWPRIARNVTRLVTFGNIHLHLDLIAGLPFEDYQRFGQSFNAVYSLRPHMLQLGFLKLLKGSGLRRQAAEHSYVFMDSPPYEVLANRYLTYAQVRRLKIIEEVFGQVYNSGRFTATLVWLTAAWGNPFGLFEDLAEYWERRDLHLVAHSSRTLYSHLADFGRTARPGIADECREFLKFDALRGESGAVRPAFLPWNGDAWAAVKTAFWRDQALVRKYLPQYTFTSWRELKNKYQLEVFDHDIPAYLAGAEKLVRKRTTVLFSYVSPGLAAYQTVSPDDLPLGR